MVTRAAGPNGLFLTVACLGAMTLLAYASWHGFVGWVRGRGGDVIADSMDRSRWGINNASKSRCLGPFPGWTLFSLDAGHTRVTVIYPDTGGIAGAGPTAAAP